MKKTNLYAKKTLSVFLAVMMLMSAWVFVAPEKASAYPDSASTVSATNTAKITELNGLDFGTGFTTTSGNFQGDNAGTMANRGYYKNTLYSPHFPASNNNLTNNDAGVYFGTLGGTADGARVWYPETTLIWDGSTTPQIPILFDIDSNNNNRVGVKNVYISSGANGLTFPDSYWTAKSECAKDTNYYTHFTFDWIMQNNLGNYWISTSSGNDKESMCSSKGYWDIYGTYLQYTGGSFGSGSTYYKAITPTWVCRTGSNYAGTTNKTIYVIDYVPLKTALAAVQGIKDSIEDYPAKYTTASVSAFVEAVKKLVAAKPNNYINSGKNEVIGWNTAVSAALSAWNSAKNLTLQTYDVTFVKKDGTVAGTHTYNYGTSVNYASLAANYENTVTKNESGHNIYTWGNLSTQAITDNMTINESTSGQASHTYGGYTQNGDTHSRTCSVCSYVQTQNHTRDTGRVTTEETCTEDGIKTYNCQFCGKEAIATETINNISGHDFTGTAFENEAGENGSHQKTCSRCGAKGWGMTEGACEKHNWDKNGDGQVNASDADTKASSCKEAGYEKYTCKVCNATWTKTLDLAEHKTKATAAKDVTNQCGGDGNAAFWTCSVCNRVWKDADLTDELADTTDADSDGIPDALETKGPEHEFTGAYVSASAGKDGTHYRQCARFTQCKTYGPEEKHTWGAPVVTEATCEKTGKKVYTCTSGCGQTYEETIEKLAHNMTKTEAVAAECGKAGNNEYYYCSICGKYYKDEAGTVETTISAEVIPALTHKWTAHHEYDTLNTPANCQSAAVYNNHCDYCKVQIIGSTHKYGNPDTVNGHNFNGDIVKNADGSHSYKCTVAGCTEAGAKTNCSFTIVVKDVASTCHTIGYTITKCADCGNEKRDEKAAYDFDNHDGAEEVRFATEAKCNTNGYTGDTYCLGCNTKIKTGTAIIADKTVHPHENMKTYEAKASTCQTEGWNAYKYCDKCGTYDLAKVTVPVRAHSFKTYTSNGDGTHTATCDTCDAAVAAPAKDTKDCAGGTANCVDKAVCTVCKVAYGDVNSASHKTIETVKKVDSTCQKEGTEAYRKCTACNTNIDTPVAIEKKAHSYGAWTQLAGEDKHTRSCTTCDADVAKVATETEACSGGTANCVEKAKCSVCKSEYGTTDSATHKTTANTLKDAVAATCQAPGYTGDYHYNCCDVIKEKGTEIAQLEHTYSIEVEGTRIPATCIAKGEVTYKCSTCAEGTTAATKKQELDIDAKNHASSDTRVVGKKDATCEEDGHTGDVYYVCCYDETKTAAENKKALKEKGTVIKANGQHVFGDAVPEYMAVIATDENGAMTLSAKAEEPTYAEKITYRHGDNKWYHVQQCTICDVIVYSACYTYAHSFNCVDTDTCEVCKGLCSLIDANNHKADLVEVTDGARAATCVEDGQKSYYKCADCGKTYFDEAGKYTLDLASEDDLAKLVISKTTVSHKWDEGTTTEGTCGEAGKITYKCTADGCTETKEISTGVSSQNHTWGTEYIEITAPTCHSVGYKVIKCTICGAVKPNSAITVPAGDHDLDKNKDGTVDREDAVIVEGENCQKPGTLTYTCQNEGCEYTKTETDTQGTSQHSFGEWVTIGGDCATGVVQERVCTACGTKEHQTLSTDTHSLVVYVLVEATAEKPGYVIYECENCKIKTDPQPLEYNGDLPSNEHIIDATQYRTVKEATCSEAEKREYGCLLCGEKIVMYYGELKPHYWLEQPAEIATCERDGHNAYYRCVRCLAEQGRVDYKATGHADGDGDGKCDECNSAFYGDTNATCGCMCHKEGGFMKFIYKIINFFWKLFKINPACECGAKHY